VVRLCRDLADERGDRVVFLSHCLLNQNSRYLGGATCPGVVVGAVERHIADGVGIVQMPCPEQSSGAVC
jgi:predicted secreted protein